MSSFLKESTVKSEIDGMISLDAHNKITSINSIAADIFGYSKEEIIGSDIKSILLDSYHDVFEGSLLEFRSEDHDCAIGIATEVKAKRKDGSEFNFLLSIVEIDQGENQEVFLIIREDGKLKKAIERRNDSEERLKSIINTAVDGIITMNTRGLVENMNPAAAKLFGYEASEVIGKNITLLMPEPHHSRHDQYLENYHTTGKKKIIGIGRDLIGLKKCGNTFPFRLAVSEMTIAGERLYTGIIHDNSLQKESEDKLIKLNEELEDKIKERTIELEKAVQELKKNNESLNSEMLKREKAESEVKIALAKEIELGELKSRFVSMASHEFRTPLSGILSSISLIARYNTPEKDEKRRVHIERIKTSVRNLTNILNDFLSIEKLQVGKVECHNIDFDLKDLALSIKEDFVQTLKQDQEIHYVHEGNETLVRLDPHLMTNILNNLLSNAIKYSSAGQKIELNTEIKDSVLTIIVQDQGIGIPEAEKERMFTRFFRAKNATNIQGTGLGLTIVKYYLNLMKGEIDFRSEEGKGTKFMVNLPQRIIDEP